MRAGSLARSVAALTDLSGRFVPSAFVIAALLTSAVFAAAFLAAGAAPGDILDYWGAGFWDSCPNSGRKWYG